MKISHPFRKKLLNASVASMLGLAASGPLNADTFELSFTGAFTMLNSGGDPVANANSPYSAGYNDPYGWLGNRTPITGTMTYDTVAGTGTITINGFQFFGLAAQNIALAHDTSLVDIDGSGGAGTLLLGNMLFDWNLTVGIPVSIVWDAQGLLGALPTAVPGTIIQGVGAVPASNGINFGTAKVPKSYPLGATPVATTTWDTTPLCNDPNPPNLNVCMNVNPSGTTPLIADTIGGSPMIDGAFQTFNANFDFMKLTVTKKNGVSAAPILQTKAPAAGATNVNVGTTVTLSFTNSMQAATIATAFSLKDAANNPIAGTLTPNTGNATNFTFTPTAPLSYVSTYTATVTSAAQDVAAQPLSGAPIVWSFTTAAQQVVTACTPVAQVPVGSNFTMLTPGGVPFGGTNDVSYTLNLTNLNTTVTGATGMYFNATISSPTPFFAHTWTAHDIRVFGPGSYDFNIDCSVAQIQNGTCAPNANPARNLTMTVGAGQLGAHMLFDWNTTQNIDVVNVWNQNSTWNSNPVDRAGTNDLWGGDVWAGPAGLAINPNTSWAHVSTDNDGDNINGVKMLDGPFQGFSANFNLGPADSCQGVPPEPMHVGTITSMSSTGCSISTKPSSITVFERSDWLFVGGFLAWLGAWRFRARKSTKA